MKLSDMDSTQLSEIGRASNLKPSLLKAACGNVDVDEKSGKVGEVALRDYIEQEIGADALADMSESGFQFPAQGGGKANPVDLISEAAARAYGHVLDQHGARAQSGSTPGATVDSIQNNRYAHVLNLKEQK